MRKRLFSLMLVIAVVSSMVPSAILASSDVTAAPTASKVLVDGIAKSFDAYGINGNNYFKLRDIAFVFNGSSKQFDVVWDGEKNAINMLSNTPYTLTGGEMSASADIKAKAAVLTTSKIYLDGNEIELTAYLIGGNNYFKLRDLGEALNFGVEWDNATNTILIKTNIGYADENTSATEPDDANNDGTQVKSFGAYMLPAGWSEASELTLGEKYFYVKDGISLDVPTSNISVEMGKNKYSLEESLAFPDAVYDQLIRQVSGSPTVSSLFGEGTSTDKGDMLIIFTIEEESLNITTKQYYIVGNYQYILIQATDFHHENIPGVSEAARVIVDSFEWAEKK